jgi:hypothetical protein
MVDSRVVIVLVALSLSAAHGAPPCVLYVPGYPDTPQNWWRFARRLHADELIPARPVVVPIPVLHAPAEALQSVPEIMSALELALDKAYGSCGPATTLVVHGWGAVMAARWASTRQVRTIALDTDAAVDAAPFSWGLRAYLLLGYAPEWLVHAWVQSLSPPPFAASASLGFEGRRFYRILARAGRIPGPAASATHALLYSETRFTSLAARERGHAFAGGHWFFMQETPEGARARSLLARLL